MTCKGPSKSTRSTDRLAISMLAPTLAPTETAYSSEHQRAAPEERFMNAISTLAARPVARPDCSINKTRQQVAWNQGNYANTRTTLNIVSEAADLKAGRRVLDVVAGAEITGPTAPRRFAKSTTTR